MGEDLNLTRYFSTNRIGTKSCITISATMELAKSSLSHNGGIVGTGTKGIEPIFTVLETAVLPLNYVPILHKQNWTSWIRTNKMQESKSCALPFGYSPTHRLPHLTPICDFEKFDLSFVFNNHRNGVHFYAVIKLRKQQDSNL